MFTKVTKQKKLSLLRTSGDKNVRSHEHVATPNIVSANLAACPPARPRAEVHGGDLVIISVFLDRDRNSPPATGTEHGGSPNHRP